MLCPHEKAISYHRGGSLDQNTKCKVTTLKIHATLLIQYDFFFLQVRFNLFLWKMSPSSLGLEDIKKDKTSLVQMLRSTPTEYTRCISEIRVSVVVTPKNYQVLENKYHFQTKSMFTDGQRIHFETSLLLLTS